MKATARCRIVRCQNTLLHFSLHEEEPCFFALHVCFLRALHRFNAWFIRLASLKQLNRTPPFGSGFLRSDRRATRRRLLRRPCGPWCRRLHVCEHILSLTLFLCHSSRTLLVSQNYCHHYSFVTFTNAVILSLCCVRNITTQIRCECRRETSTSLQTDLDAIISFFISFSP